jgi:LPXTG-motif cell wall-anchored protein
MKRIAIAMAAATLVVLALSGPAIAGYPPSPTPSESETPSVSPTETETPPNSPSPTSSVLGETVTVSPGTGGTGGTAFTGSDVMGPLALGGVLLVVGLALLYVSRRRAAADDR